ncbi:MAG TPA: tyrosine-protein phosphatase [Vicinamibacterales bacterium]|nr:tyrosine-protein phosphatase [Vicinamibacterales bacterium]
MHFSRNTVRAAVAALFLTFSVALPVGAGTPAAGQVSGVRIDNFGRVSDVYYRGGQPQGRDYADLAAIGVKTVVDLQNDGEANEGADAARASLKFFRIGMSSTSAPSAAQVDQFLSIVNNPANQPVFVHCKGGKHRTGTLTAVYRMTHDGWTADRAFQEMLQYDFGSGMGHGGQKNFVYAYATNADRTRTASAGRATAGQQ